MLSLNKYLLSCVESVKLKIGPFGGSLSARGLENKLYSHVVAEVEPTLDSP